MSIEFYQIYSRKILFLGRKLFRNYVLVKLKHLSTKSPFEPSTYYIEKNVRIRHFPTPLSDEYFWDVHILLPEQVLISNPPPALIILQGILTVIFLLAKGLIYTVEKIKWNYEKDFLILLFYVYQFLFASSWPKLLSPRPSNTTIKIEKMNNLQKIVNVASKSVLCSTYQINELILHKFVLFSQSLNYRYTSSSSSKGSASSYFRK